MLKIFKEFLMNRKNILRAYWRYAPDMGRAYQELGHLNRDMGNEDKSVMHYRQALRVKPSFAGSMENFIQLLQKK